MPPKAKYTKEEIGNTAFEMVRKFGMSVLSARSLATELGTSTAPIFTAFHNIDEVEEFVVGKAEALYKKYLEEGLSSHLPFKGAGMKYVEFAKNEPELFRLLFMGESEEGLPSHYLPGENELSKTILKTVENSFSMEENSARKLYNHLSVYAHGLAVLYAQGCAVFTLEDVDRMLGEVFLSLKEGLK